MDVESPPVALWGYLERWSGADHNGGVLGGVDCLGRRRRTPAWNCRSNYYEHGEATSDWCPGKDPELAVTILQSFQV